jgi:hypothetical protein
MSKLKPTQWQVVQRGQKFYPQIRSYLFWGLYHPWSKIYFDAEDVLYKSTASLTSGMCCESKEQAIILAERAVNITDKHRPQWNVVASNNFR